MRTPWKMLADLVSGKPSKDDAETNAQGNDADKDDQAGRVDSQVASAAVIKPAAHDEITDLIAPHPAVSQQTSKARSQPSTDENLTEIKAVEIAEKASVTTASELVGGVFPQLETEPTKPAERRSSVATPIVPNPNKPAVKRANKTAPTPRLTAPSDNASVDNSAFEEMSALNHEIEDLRRRLAEKLTLQNVQLRELIDRYDGQ